MIEVLFEDEGMLAVNKPSGLLTQAPRGIDSLELRVKEYLAGKSGKPLKWLNNPKRKSKGNKLDAREIDHIAEEIKLDTGEIDHVAEEIKCGAGKIDHVTEEIKCGAGEIDRDSGAVLSCGIGGGGQENLLDFSMLYLGVPHRLDRPVSGVILFGKTSRTTHKLSEQFEERQIDKTYWGVVEGNVKDDSGTWIDYMRKVPNCPLAEIVLPIAPDAREAILNYTVLKRFKLNNQNFTHLEIKLETGRTHQIRLQSSHNGYPILGDATYHSTTPFGENFDNDRNRAIALHAHSITFTAPLSNKKINLTAQTPPLWNMLDLQ
ncbi:MAG: RNA pseudouridine synthase [Planctomycetaceae bacterium]|jgi:23S rRNA-/tRNA-specific pseudouridylate synthase|nr:RNA pseudouridine synthase [Planctomycetaceae bacterium]